MNEDSVDRARKSLWHMYNLGSKVAVRSLIEYMEKEEQESVDIEFLGCYLEQIKEFKDGCPDD